MITLDDFKTDSQGKKFSDVLSDPRINFSEVIDFFNNPIIITRMEDSETHHDRPPLAGVIKEFEKQPDAKAFLTTYDAHTTFRYRQAVGVLVRLHMEKIGWKKAGVKGSLGTRENVTPPTTRPGAYVNKHGLSKWFTRAERYIKHESGPIAKKQSEP